MDTNSVISKLIGTWKVAKIGVDSNNNQKIDSNEISPVDPGFDERFLFDANMTGSISVGGYNLGFNWSLSSNNENIIISDLKTESKKASLFKITAPASLTFHIENLQPKNLDVNFIEDGELGAYYMVRV